MKHDNSKPSNSPYQRNIDERVARAMVDAKLKTGSKAAGHAPQTDESKADPFHFGSPVDPESQARVEAMQQRRAEKRKAALVKTLAEMSEPGDRQ